MRPTALAIVLVLIAALARHGLGAVDLVSNLGSPPNSDATFGEHILPRDDDSADVEVDVRPIFPQGMRFGGVYFDSFFVNTNGNITFRSRDGTFVPQNITARAILPRIAPYFADVDTRSGPGPTSPSGKSRGTNLVYWDLDLDSKIITITWDDVGYYSRHTDNINAFQLRLHRVGDDGSFDIEFRYEYLSWADGDASRGVPARAGYTAANNSDFFELPQSGDENGMLGLATDPDATNTIPAEIGRFLFPVRSPKATITPSSGRTNADPIRFRVTWDTEVRDFAINDLTVTGGTLGDLTEVTPDLVYLVAVRPAGDGPVTLGIRRDAAFNRHNGNGNAPIEARVFSDRTPPTATLTPATGTVHTVDVALTATFSEPVTDFNAQDVEVDNGRVTRVHRSGNTATIIVSTSSDGPLHVTLFGNYTDLAGNHPVAPTQAALLVDTLGPNAEVTVNPTGPTNATDFTYTIIFADPVTGFTVDDLEATNGVVSSPMTGSGAGPYVVTVTATTSGPVTLLVRAGAGRDGDGLGNLAGSATAIHDSTPPLVAILVPTGPVSAPFTAHLDFSEPVVIGAGDVSAVNATVGATTLVPGTLSRYTVTITPTGGGAQIIALTVDAVVDLAGNSMAAPASVVITSDDGLADLLITTSVTPPSSATTIPVTFTFPGGASTGFTAGDVQVTGGRAGPLLGVGPFTMDVAATGDGPVVIGVPAGACQVGGIGNGAARLTVNRDGAGPRPSFRIDPIHARSGQSVLLTITFAESITGFTVDDVVVEGGTASGFTGSGTTYAVRIDTAGRPSYRTVVRLPVGAAADLAGNPSPASSVVVASGPPPPVPEPQTSCGIGSGFSMLLLMLLGAALPLAGTPRRRR